MNNFERMINVGIEFSLNISRNVLTLVKVDEATGREETSKRIRSCVRVCEKSSWRIEGSFLTLRNSVSSKKDKIFRQTGTGN